MDHQAKYIPTMTMKSASKGKSKSGSCNKKLSIRLVSGLQSCIYEEKSQNDVTFAKVYVLLNHAAREKVLTRPEGNHFAVERKTNYSSSPELPFSRLKIQDAVFMVSNLYFG